MMRIHNRQRGFTLIELLIVVAIIGIIAAILIPNFLDALQKGRQKRTMGDFRELGTAIAAYYTDVSGAAAAGVTITFANYGGDDPVTTAADLETLLVPDYCADVPNVDGWGSDVEYMIDMTNPSRSQYLAMRSPGSNEEFEADSYDVGTYPPTDYEQDIVFVDGAFARCPAGAAQGT